MSLSKELQNPNSIISRFLNSALDPVETRILLHQYNIQMDATNTIRLRADVDPALVGTAFDYAFRWTLADHLIAPDLVGLKGAEVADNMRFQHHVDALTELVQRGNITPHLRAPVSIILSWYESIYRSGNDKYVMPCFNTPSSSAKESIKKLTMNVPIEAVADIQQLMSTIPRVWGKRLGKSYTLNPTLPNSGYVGGADGDWIVDGILYDCKCSWRNSPFKMGHFRQVLAYALLDWDDELNLRGVGWYYARQKFIIEMPLTDILPDIYETRASLKALYHRQTDLMARQSSLSQLEAELDDILWKHHGDQITSENLRRSGWG